MSIQDTAHKRADLTGAHNTGQPALVLLPALSVTMLVSAPAQGFPFKKIVCSPLCFICLHVVVVIAQLLAAWQPNTHICWRWH